MVRSCVVGTVYVVPTSEPVEAPPMAARRVAPVRPMTLAAAASLPLYDVLEYLECERQQLPWAPFSITQSSARETEVLISFPSTSTSGKALSETRKQAGRRPGGLTNRPKTRYTS